MEPAFPVAIPLDPLVIGGLMGEPITEQLFSSHIASFDLLMQE